MGEFIFPNHLINVLGGCILSRDITTNIWRVQDNIIVNERTIHVLDTVYYFPDELIDQDKYYSVLINFNYPRTFANPNNYCKFLVTEYIENLKKILSNTLDPNCDIKNISDIIFSFYMDMDNIEIKLIYNNTVTFPFITLQDLGFQYSNHIPLSTQYGSYFYIPNPKQNSTYHLGIFSNNKLISKSDKINIHPSYLAYEHYNIIPNNYIYNNQNLELFGEMESSDDYDEYDEDEYSDY